MSRREEPFKEVVAPLTCTKELYREPNIPRRIQQICFGVQTPQEIVKVGVFNVYERALYKMPERVPHPNGVLDRRLGVSNKNYVCETCGQRLAECSGHFGFIRLELPVFHIGYFKNTVQLLQCICKSCARLLLTDEERQKWLKKFRNPRVERTQRDQMFRRVNELCKRQKICPHCGEWNGTCKKTTGSLKIIHDKYNKNDALLETFKDSLSEAMRHNDALRSNLCRAADDLHPLRVRSLFERIPAEDCGVLDIVGRPEDLVVTHLTVPPMCIRPSVDMDGASNEDDITMKLMQIIEVNNVLRQGLEKGLPVANLMENWDFLQVQCAMLINSDLPGLPKEFTQASGRPLRGFVQRLKGKQGRFRGNLSGKRVDFSGRTVISPDPNLEINQVCVPKHMAVVLTYPERATRYSMDKLRQRILNGSLTWPGANYVVSASGERVSLKFGDRRKVAADLKIGDTVERHLEDGDVVLFNRQPSLHRISIMAFRAKVRIWRTLRFNECVCTPFNADFDGDEMNLHLPQTEEARAEAIMLMGSVNNLCTPKNGEILVASTQDFLTCAYLITSKDTFYARADMSLLASYMTGGRAEVVELPVPAILKPLELWTGKQLFGLLIRPNKYTKIFINVEMPEKQYSKKGQHMCPRDGYVCFRNSELICGRIGKVVLGGRKGGLYGTLNSDFSAEAAAQVMSRLARLSARHMGNRGFSIGIDDVQPMDMLQREKAKMIAKGYSECLGFIAAHKKGKLEVLTGCDLDQTLENRVMGVLNNIREQAASVCMDTLRPTNSPLIMSQCGSKGSPINIAQMVACVGQQSVGGRRAFNGFKERTLPHYPRNDRTPAGKGFVANSFYSGLTATEFWFHTMGGREGLVDTAVKTAETGYMSRRLMKALEDLYTHYDRTVRNAAGGIVQFMYGDDGMDPVVMEAEEGKPIDFTRMLAKVRATAPRAKLTETRDESGAVIAKHGRDEVPLPRQLAADVARALARPQLAEYELEQAYRAWCSHAFLTQMRNFLQAQLDKYQKARLRLGLPADARGEAGLEYAAGMEGLTPAQLQAFIDKCIAKYDKKRIDPGATVGAVGAQSIGEPGTQMTLKTFHFAGVASMNVTQGVPRIKEIINDSKNISTPIMTVALEVDTSETFARVVKARLERTTLEEVARSIRVVFKPGHASGRVGEGEAMVSVRLDAQAIGALQLPINARTVRAAILNTPRMRLKEQHVREVGEWKLVVNANVDPDRDRGSILFALNTLLKALPKVIVSGIPTVERAVIKREKDNTYTLLVEGTDLRRVMATPGVLGRRTTINHVHENVKYLGIEAARRCIIEQIETTMNAHGMSIDHRHTMLLADCMTYKGEVLGITRFGISKMKDSVLHTASFERTSDHLFDAAIHGRCDDVVGVSESIIMGIPMPVGTGIFRIRQNCSEIGLLPKAAAPALCPGISGSGGRSAIGGAAAG